MGINPDGDKTFTYNKGTTASALTELCEVSNSLGATVYSTYTSYAPTLYVKAEDNGDGTVSYTLPQVLITLTNAGKADGVGIYQATVGGETKNVWLTQDANGDWVWDVGELNEDGSFTAGKLTKSNNQTWLMLSYDGCQAVVYTKNRLSVTTVTD